jgi:hypothetical protein
LAEPTVNEKAGTMAATMVVERVAMTVLLLADKMVESMGLIPAVLTAAQKEYGSVEKMASSSVAKLVVKRVAEMDESKALK